MKSFQLNLKTLKVHGQDIAEYTAEGSSSVGGILSPPHHRHAGATRCAKLRESVQENRRRSKAPNCHREYKPKASNPPRPSQRTSSAVKKTARRPRLESREPVHTESTRLHEENGEAPLYEVAAPSNPPRTSPRTSSKAAKKKTRRPRLESSIDSRESIQIDWTRMHEEDVEVPPYEVVEPIKVMDEKGHLIHWRCTFSDEDGVCDEKRKSKPGGKRHALTHHRLGWPCANLCGLALSRKDALDRHYKSDGCKTVGMVIQRDTNLRVLVRPDGRSQVVRLQWLAASDVDGTI